MVQPRFLAIMKDKLGTQFCLPYPDSPFTGRK